MMELDVRYADVIVKRYIDKVGSDADVFILRDGEKIRYLNLKREKVAV